MEKQKERDKEQHRLDEKAEIEFIKRLKTSDEHNLVGDRIKLDTSQSVNSDESDFFGEIRGADSNISLSRFIKKKPRPREIIHGITDKKARKLAKIA